MIKCSICGSEYILHEHRYPIKDVGGSVECTKCGATLHTWGKGTRDYSLEPYDKYNKRMTAQVQIAELAPKCSCGAKMIIKFGPYGEFWGCPKYPKCDRSKKITDKQEIAITQIRNNAK